MSSSFFKMPLQQLQRPLPPRYASAGRVTARLLLSLLALSPPIAAIGRVASSQQETIPSLPPSTINPPNPQAATGEHTFTLRHIFHYGDLDCPSSYRRLDISKPDSTVWIESEDGLLEDMTRPLIVRSGPMNIHRLKDRRPSVVDPIVAAAREQDSYSAAALSPSAWTLDELDGPNITDRDTVLTFAQMTANAYELIPGQGDWKEVEGGFNRTNDHGFGWEGKGLRGYLYADDSNSTIVISLKGTSRAVWDGEDTTTNDKENDNLFFSCCCGQQGSTLYRQVCDCAIGTYTCNVSCVKKSLRKENRYYAAGRYLYSNVTALYPGANVWLTGHSLGGSVSAMLGLTYGVPAVTFEAVPDALPASRLGLPIPPGVDPNRPGKRDFTGAYHFGHTADPVFMGTCNGATGSCTYSGYALESACHTGRECVYDTVGVNGTRVLILSHGIAWVIKEVIKKWTTVPECTFTPECYDCPLWKEVEGSMSRTATTPPSTSTKPRTRTATCRTPGWWGCLDETSTTSGSTTRKVTTTTSTSTCRTPGWFGCNDETTTTAKSSHITPTVTSSRSTTCEHLTSAAPAPTSTYCKTPGLFWGCHDGSTTTQSHTITTPPAMPSLTTASTSTMHSCTSSAWFGFICVDPSPTRSPTSNPTPTRPPEKEKAQCLRRSWIGFCWEWDKAGMNWREEI